MTDAFLSVVIPAFNAAPYITIAIESALGQSIDDLEVVVVDDGSTDETAALISQVKDPRLRLIRQENQGQSVAINEGVKNSRGAYIKLLDADDWLNPNHLEAQLGVIKGRADVLASCRWGHFVDDFSRPTVREEITYADYDNPLEWLFDSLTQDEGMMGGGMWLIPKSLWCKVGGFDPRLSLNNDFHFSISLLLASNGVRHAKEAIYSYRRGITGSLSSSLSRNAMESAYLTTELGTACLLEREDSPRMRKICADRFQQWLFIFYPQHQALATKAEQRIRELGGSKLELQGGPILRLLKPILGWKGVRRLQSIVYRIGWQRVLELKRKNRLAGFQ